MWIVAILALGIGALALTSKKGSGSGSAGHSVWDSRTAPSGNNPQFTTGVTYQVTFSPAATFAAQGQFDQWFGNGVFSISSSSATQGGVGQFLLKYNGGQAPDGSTAGPFFYGDLAQAFQYTNITTNNPQGIEYVITT